MYHMKNQLLFLINIFFFFFLFLFLPKFLSLLGDSYLLNVFLTPLRSMSKSFLRSYPFLPAPLDDLIANQLKSIGPIPFESDENATDVHRRDPRGPRFAAACSFVPGFSRNRAGRNGMRGGRGEKGKRRERARLVGWRPLS